VTAPAFDVRREAVMRGEGLPASVEGTAAFAGLERNQPERMTVRAQGPGLLVVGEHFDPGWRAIVGGRPQAVAEVDLAAVGVVLPPGPATVELRFVPVGLWPGLALAIAAAAALGGASAARRRWGAVG
jgi:hypothetical protein